MMSFAMVSLLLTAISSLAIRLVGESRAQIAADSAALAGVLGGESTARRLALMNGAVLCEFRSDSIVSVRVCAGSKSARAYAREEQVVEVPTLNP